MNRQEIESGIEQNSSFSGMNRRTFLLLSSIALAGCNDAKNVIAPPRKNPNGPSVPEQADEDHIRRAVITYMTDPRFAGTDLIERMTGEQIRVEKHYYDIETLLLSMKDSDYRGAVASFGRLLNDPDKAHFATATEGDDLRYLNTQRRQKLDIQLTQSGAGISYTGMNRYLFSAHEDNLRIEPDEPIVYTRNDITYNVTPRELLHFLTNESIYGGYKYIVEETDDGLEHVTVNFGTRVARTGEPSLTRLVERLVKEGDTNETKAQKMLEFVTDGIRYSDSDVRFEEAAGVELIKRPNEVIMSGEGDCASKALTLASLYEQAGLNYYLVYQLPTGTSAGHLTNLVEGNFGNRNGMEFEIGGKKFSIAEATSPGFRIGQTGLQGGTELEHITYIQRPSDGTVYDPKTGKVIRKSAVK